MPSQRETESPCTSCGACCAYFRVAFYWREAEDGGGQGPGVPVHLTEDLDSFRRFMKGTNQKRNNQCTALKGRVGECVSCTIYENRPSPCRNFRASYVDGGQNKRCNEARAAHGLKPLTPADSNLTLRQDLLTLHPHDENSNHENSNDEHL